MTCPIETDLSRHLQQLERENGCDDHLDALTDEITGQLSAGERVFSPGNIPAFYEFSDGVTNAFDADIEGMNELLRELTVANTAANTEAILDAAARIAERIAAGVRGLATELAEERIGRDAAMAEAERWEAAA